MPKLEYKPIAVQDEMWEGKMGDASRKKEHRSPEITVLIKMVAEGKTIHYKNDAMTFSNAEALAKWIEENKVEILPGSEFKKLGKNY